jgi:hypothetical protein
MGAVGTFPKVMGRTRSIDVRSLADGLGILGSAICALHCLAAPAVLVAGTALPSFLATDESFHRMLLWAILPASLLAFGLGCWRHKDSGVLVLGVLGLFGLCAAVAAPRALIGENGERILAVVSAGLLIAAHLRNFRRCHADDCEHERASE